MWRFAVVAVIACGSKSEEPPPPREVPSQMRDARATAADASPAVDASTPDAAPRRRVIEETELPMHVLVDGDLVYWASARGQALWAKPWRGQGPARKLDARAMFIGQQGGELYGSMDKDLAKIVRPRGTAKPLGLQLPDTPLEIIGDDEAIYVTLYAPRDVVRIANGTWKKLVAGDSIALQGDTLYASSYRRGTIVAVPKRGGAARTIARGLPRPTGFAVDERHAFVWCEKDQTLRRIELATGASTTLATGTNNSDTLVADGDWIYLWSWGQPSKLLRVAKDGSKTETIADDLGAPHDIAVDATGVFVADRDRGEILRFEKSAIGN